MLEKYPEDLKIAFKNFPLRMHNYAAKAAVAALAAKEQGKFWEFHDILYDNYSSLSDEKVMEFARGLSLDMEKFRSSLNDRDLVSIIKRDYMEGVKAGVRGTPTVFINGRLQNDKSVKGVSATIERELQKKRK